MTKITVEYALKSAKISADVVEFSNEPVEYTTSYENFGIKESSADPSTGNFCLVFGSFKEVTMNDEYNNYGHSHTRCIEGGDCVIVKSVVDFSTTLNRRTEISRLVIRPGADEEKVARWLYEQFSTRFQILERATKVALVKKEISARLEWTVEDGGITTTKKINPESMGGVRIMAMYYAITEWAKVHSLYAHKIEHNGVEFEIVSDSSKKESTPSLKVRMGGKEINPLEAVTLGIMEKFFYERVEELAEQTLAIRMGDGKILFHSEKKGVEIL